MENSDDLFLSRVNVPVQKIASLADYRLDLTRVHLVNARLTVIDDDLLRLQDLTSLTLKVVLEKFGVFVVCFFSCSLFSGQHDNRASQLGVALTTARA